MKRTGKRQGKKGEDRKGKERKGQKKKSKERLGKERAVGCQVLPCGACSAECSINLTN